MLEVWVPVALGLAAQFLAIGVMYGRMMGRLRLIEYRIGQLEGALRVLGLKTLITPQDASV